MANPVLVPTGQTAWKNDVNNWRANDADWLQSRGILRWPDAATRNAAPATYRDDGTIAFISSFGGGPAFVGRSGGADQKLFTATNLILSADTPAAINLRLAGGGSTAGVQIEANRVTITGLPTAGASFVAGPLLVTNTAVNIVASDGTQAPLSKSTAAAGGTLQIGGASGLTVVGPVLLQSTLTVTGNTVLSVLTVSGTVTLNNGLTVSGGNIVGTLLGNVVGNLTSSSSVIGGLTIQSNAITSGANSVNVTTGTTPTTGVTLKTTGAARAQVDDGSTFTGPIASVHVASTAPVAEDYPEGCLWVQV